MILLGALLMKKPYKLGCVVTKKPSANADGFFYLVGMTGFEPATSSSRTKRATGLRYIPFGECKCTHYGGFIKINAALVRPRLGTRTGREIPRPGWLAWGYHSRNMRRFYAMSFSRCSNNRMK